jgi:hypothetical protein
MSKLDIAEKMIIQRRIRELGCGLRNIMSRSFNWDIIVLLEIDTSLLLGWIVDNAKEFPL